MNNDFPVLDGIAPSWADVIVRATPKGGTMVETHLIKSINSSVKVDVGMIKSGGRPFKTTTGEESSEASWTLYHEGAIQLLRGLVALAPQRGSQYLISLVHFDIQIQWTPRGSVEVFERLIQGCRVVGNSLQAAEGTDATAVELALNPKKVVDMIDGKEVVLL